MTRRAGYRISACPGCVAARLFAVYGSINTTCPIPRDSADMASPVKCACGRVYSTGEARFLEWARDVRPAEAEGPVIPAFFPKDLLRLGVRAAPPRKGAMRFCAQLRQRISKIMRRA